HGALASATASDRAVGAGRERALARSFAGGRAIRGARASTCGLSGAVRRATRPAGGVTAVFGLAAVGDVVRQPAAVSQSSVVAGTEVAGATLLAGARVTRASAVAGACRRGGYALVVAAPAARKHCDANRDRAEGAEDQR